MLRNVLTSMAIASLWLTPGAEAQEAADIVAAYGAATAREDWSAAAAFFGPDELARLREGFTLLLGPDGDTTAVFGDRTRSQVEALSDRDYVAQIFGFVFSEVRGKGVAMTMEPPVVLGTVEETAQLVHVVYRQEGTLNGAPLSVVDLASVKRVDASWYVAVPDEFNALITGVEQIRSSQQNGVP